MLIIGASAASRMFRHLRHLDYSTRLDNLGLWSLEEQRNRAD